MSLRTKAVAFMARDLIQEASYRLNFVFQFLGMLFTVFSFYFLSKLIGRAAVPHLAPYGGDYFAFALTGVAFTQFLTVSLSSFSQQIRMAQVLGTLEAMLVTRTGIAALVMLSSLFPFLFTLVRVMLLIAVGVLFFDVPLHLSGLPVAVVVLLLTVCAFAGIGILGASFIMVFKRFEPVTWMVGGLSYLLGGVVYPVSVLPEWLRPLSQVLPITHALEAIRLTLIAGRPTADALPSIFYLLVLTAITVPAGLLAFSHAVARARRDGTLTHY